MGWRTASDRRRCGIHSGIARLVQGQRQHDIRGRQGDRQRFDDFVARLGLVGQAAVLLFGQDGYVLGLHEDPRQVRPRPPA